MVRFFIGIVLPKKESGKEDRRTPEYYARVFHAHIIIAF